MKASELMIGSLVEHNGYVYKVMGIYGNAKFVDLFPCEHRNKENELLGPLTVMEQGISPIPLTEERLKANGWKNIRSIIYGCEFEEVIKGEIHHFDVPFRVGISPAYCHEKMFTTINDDLLLNIEYVHELQHALRLCGLNDLADNFKVSD